MNHFDIHDYEYIREILKGTRYEKVVKSLIERVYHLEKTNHELSLAINKEKLFLDTNEFVIVTADNILKLEEDVKEKIRCGFSVVGSPKFNEKFFYQSVVRHDGESIGKMDVELVNLRKENNFLKNDIKDLREDNERLRKMLSDAVNLKRK